MFADAMDMPSLLKWRLACKANYIQVSSALWRSLLKLLRPFVPIPREFLDILTKYRALIGGEFALSFLLRDPTYLPPKLDVYVSDFEFDSLCDAVLDDPHIRQSIDSYVYTNNTIFDSLRRLISCTLTIRSSSGNIIYIHRSYTTSAVAPITRGSCTALSNFVTAYGFGCSHPMLTFKRRALLADLDFPFLPPLQRDEHANILKHGFTLSVSPAAWPEYQWPCIPLSDYSASLTDGLEDGSADALQWTHPSEAAQSCSRRFYTCPSQGRFFGDRGSLVVFFDSLGGDDAYCEEHNIAPFGPMIVWRIISSFACDDGCDFDDIIEEGVTSIPVFIRRDPCGELRDVVSDRYMGKDHYY